MSHVPCGLARTVAQAAVTRTRRQGLGLVVLLVQTPSSPGTWGGTCGLWTPGPCPALPPLPLKLHRFPAPRLCVGSCLPCAAPPPLPQWEAGPPRVVPMRPMAAAKASAEGHGARVRGGLWPRLARLSAWAGGVRLSPFSTVKDCVSQHWGCAVRVTVRAPLPAGQSREPD